MKAEGFISSGYQRLLTFEVPGGGFSWFGEQPAHPLLTAYGLMELKDMQKVYPVDEKVIERTQEWLCKTQNSDGSFSPDQREMHSGPQATGRTVLHTAYITWSLLETGCRGETVLKAVAYLRNHIEDTEDPYTMALIANALGLYDSRSGDTDRAIRKLVGMAKKEDAGAYWTCSSTATCSYGESGNVEATALASQALLRFSGEAALLQKSLDYLVSTRRSSGAWDSTQATILSLRVLIESQKRPVQCSGAIRVKLNGRAYQSIEITPETSDVLKMVEMGKEVKCGENTLDLSLEGNGSYMYQIVGKYYMPWRRQRDDSKPGLAIKVAYDRTVLSSQDILKAEARISSEGGEVSSMVIADLGLPPGFTAFTGDFDELRQQGVISRYEVTPRKIILYLDGIKGSVTLPYRLKARFPIRAKTPPSRVYEYYNPANQAADIPQDLTVR